MNNIELESEVIQISTYCNIVCQILFLHRNLSINKVLFFSYLLKKYKNLTSKIYTAKDSRDLTYKAISMLSGEYEDYCNNIEFIIKAIHLLNLNGNINVEDNMLYFVSRKSYDKLLYDENSFIYNAIEDSKKITEKQFLKEIVQNV